MSRQPSQTVRLAQRHDEHRQISEQLAYAGAIPFLLLAAALLIPSDFVPFSSEQLHQAMQLYGLVVVNFVAGSLWGRAIDNPERHHRGNGQLFAVVVSLISWFSFALPPTSGLLVLTCLFVGLRLHEAFAVRGESRSDWYSKARSRLTFVASASLCVAAIS